MSPLIGGKFRVIIQMKSICFNCKYFISFFRENSLSYTDQNLLYFFLRNMKTIRLKIHFFSY